MNERVLELAKQAGLKKEHGADREYIGDFDWREFAELIVRECAGLVQGVPTDSMGYHTAEQKIKQHFGVEE